MADLGRRRLVALASAERRESHGFGTFGKRGAIIASPPAINRLPPGQPQHGFYLLPVVRKQVESPEH
jgi:hypothetical protein